MPETTKPFYLEDDDSKLVKVNGKIHHRRYKANHPELPESPVTIDSLTIIFAHGDIGRRDRNSAAWVVLDS
jgi:hypothetical protein